MRLSDRDGYQNNFLFQPGSMWFRVTGSMKEAFFPTRCLVCGSFFRNSRQENRRLKTFLQILSSWEQGFFGLEGFFQKTDLTKEHVEECLDTDAKIFVALMSPFICTNCSGTYMAVESPICSTCGVAFESREGEDHHCGECLIAPKRFRTARSAGVYDKVLMAAIHCLKYKGKIQLARPFSVLLFMAFCRYWNKENINLIAPVPLHKRKFRSRGFNTSFLLVKEWALITKALNRAVPVIPVVGDILVRKRWTESQTGLRRKERLQNIKNAFGVSDSSKVKGKNILLVDDVYTTGATVNECAKVLLRAGAARVDVLTLARAM
ncbi:MAG: ComF family protein [Desulfobacterales bacterium]|nr:ComF family protein [Desulfobacterales bacterium]